MTRHATMYVNPKNNLKMNEATMKNDNMDDVMQGEELEALRSRMRSLRDRLDSQQLVTDTLLRDVVRRSTDYSRRYFKLEKFLMLPVGILAMSYLYYRIDLPLWFFLFTVVMLAVEVFADWRITRLANLDYGSTPLLEIQERLVRQKRQRARRMLAGMVLVVIWLALGVYVVAAITPSSGDAVNLEEFRKGMCVGGAIGGVCGLWFGLNAYFKMQRENEQAIRRLRDFTEK